MGSVDPPPPGISNIPPNEIRITPRIKNQKALPGFKLKKERIPSSKNMSPKKTKMFPIELNRNLKKLPTSNRRLAPKIGT